MTYEWISGVILFKKVVMLKMPNRSSFIAIFTLIIIIFFICAGCSLSYSPEEVVTNYLDTIKKGDYEESKKFIYVSQDSDDFFSNNDNDAEKTEMRNEILGKISYKVLSSKISGDTASVDIEITSVDLSRIFSKAISELMPLAFASAFDKSKNANTNVMLEQYMKNSINDPNVLMTSTNTKLELKKVNDAWLLVANDDLLNSLTGNIGKAFSFSD